MQNKKKYIFEDRKKNFPSFWNENDIPFPVHKLENAIGTIYKISIPQSNWEENYYDISVIQFTNKLDESEKENNTYFHDMEKEELEEIEKLNESNKVASNNSWLGEQANKNYEFFCHQNSPETKEKPAQEGKDSPEDEVKKKVAYDFRFLDKMRILITPHTLDALSDLLETMTNEIGSVDSVFDRLQKDRIAENYFHERWTVKEFFLALSIPQLIVGMYSKMGKNLQCQLSLDKAVIRVHPIIEWNLKDTRSNFIDISNFEKNLKSIEIKEILISSIEFKHFEESTFSDDSMKEYNKLFLLDPKNSDLTKILINKFAASASYENCVGKGNCSLNSIEIKMSQSLPLHSIKLLHDWFDSLRIFGTKFGSFVEKQKEVEIQLVGATLYRLVELYKEVQTKKKKVQVDKPFKLFSKLSPLKHPLLGRLATSQRHSWLDILILRYYYKNLFSSESVHQELNQCEHISSPSSYFHTIVENFKSIVVNDKNAHDFYLEKLIKNSGFLHNLFQFDPKKFKKLGVANVQESSEDTFNQKKEFFSESDLIDMDKEKSKNTREFSVEISMELQKTKLMLMDSFVEINKVLPSIKIFQIPSKSRKLIFVEPSLSISSIKITLENKLVQFLTDLKVVFDEIEGKKNQFRIENFEKNIETNEQNVSTIKEKKNKDNRVVLFGASFNLDKFFCYFYSKSGSIEFSIDRVAAKNEINELFYRSLVNNEALQKEQKKRVQIHNSELNVSSVKILVGGGMKKSIEINKEKPRNEILSIVLRKIGLNEEMGLISKKTYKVKGSTNFNEINIDFDITKAGKIKNFVDEWTKVPIDPNKVTPNPNRKVKKSEEVIIKRLSKEEKFALSFDVFLEKISISTQSVTEIGFKYLLPHLHMEIKFSNIENEFGELNLSSSVKEHRMVFGNSKYFLFLPSIQLNLSTKKVSVERKNPLLFFSNTDDTSYNECAILNIVDLNLSFSKMEKSLSEELVNNMLVFVLQIQKQIAALTEKFLKFSQKMKEKEELSKLKKERKLEKSRLSYYDFFEDSSEEKELNKIIEGEESELRYSAKIIFEGFKINLIAPNNQIKLNIEHIGIEASNHTKLKKDSEIKLSLKISKLSLLLVNSKKEILEEKKTPSSTAENLLFVKDKKPIITKKRDSLETRHESNKPNAEILAAIVFSLHLETGEDKEKKKEARDLVNNEKEEKKSKTGQFIKIFQGILVTIKNPTIIFHPQSVIKIVETLLFYKKKLKEFETQKSYSPIKEVFTKVQQVTQEKIEKKISPEENILSLKFEIRNLNFYLIFSPASETHIEGEYSSLGLSLDSFILKGSSHVNQGETDIAGDCQLGGFKVCYKQKVSPEDCIKEDKKLPSNSVSLIELKEIENSAVIKHGEANLSLTIKKKGDIDASLSVSSSGIDVQINPKLVHFSHNLKNEVFKAKDMIPQEILSSEKSEKPKNNLPSKEKEKPNKDKKIIFRFAMNTKQGSCTLYSKEWKKLDIFFFPSLFCDIYYKSALPSIKNRIKDSETSKTIVSITLEKAKVVVNPSCLVFLFEFAEELKKYSLTSEERATKKFPEFEEKSTEKDQESMGNLVVSIMIEGISIELVCTRDIISRLEVNQLILFITNQISKRNKNSLFNATLSVESVVLSLQNKWFDDDSKFRFSIYTIQSHLSKKEVNNLYDVNEILVSLLTNIDKIESQFSLGSLRSIFIFKTMWLDGIPKMTKKNAQPKVKEQNPLEEKKRISVFGRVSIQGAMINVDLQSTGKSEIIIHPIDMGFGFPDKKKVKANKGSFSSFLEPKLDLKIINEKQANKKVNHLFWFNFLFGGINIKFKERLSGTLDIGTIALSGNRSRIKGDSWKLKISPNKQFFLGGQKSSSFSLNCELQYDASKVVMVHLENFKMSLKKKEKGIEIDCNLNDLEIQVSSKTIQSIYSIGQKMKESVDESHRYASENVLEFKNLQSVSSSHNQNYVVFESTTELEKKDSENFKVDYFLGKIDLHVTDEKGIKILIFPFELSNNNGILLELNKFNVSFEEDYQCNEMVIVKKEEDKTIGPNLFSFDLESLKQNTTLKNKLSIHVGIAACKIHRHFVANEMVTKSKEDIIRVPISTMLSLETLFNIQQKEISYSLTSDFKQNIFLTTTLDLYAYLKEVIDIVSKEAKKPSIFSSKQKVEIIKKESDSQEEIWRKGINFKKILFEFDPKVNILGNTTPPVLSWVYSTLGVKHFDIEMPIFFYTKMSKNFTEALILINKILSNLKKN